MTGMSLAVIDHWITTFDWQAIRDILLESLAILGFIFLLIVVIIAMKRSPILTSHGSIEILFFVILGLCTSIMNVLDEFIWFHNIAFKYWKLSKGIILLVGAVILIVGFFRFFAFSSRLFGEEIISDEKMFNEETLKEQT
ncbi:MAG: hypothetical protein FK733_06620 [Asgard group archaeon]|nr:hypothetical protein [Asgard group archaeon]